MAADLQPPPSPQGKSHRWALIAGHSLPYLRVGPWTPASIFSPLLYPVLL